MRRPCPRHELRTSPRQSSCRDGLAMAVVIDLPCAGRARAVRMPCLRHALPMPSPRPCHALAMPSPWRRHAWGGASTMDCRGFAMTAMPCHCHALGTPLPCQRQTFDLSSHCCRQAFAAFAMVVAVPVPCLGHVFVRVAMASQWYWHALAMVLRCTCYACTHTLAMPTRGDGLATPAPNDLAKPCVRQRCATIRKETPGNYQVPTILYTRPAGNQTAMFNLHCPRTR